MTTSYIRQVMGEGGVVRRLVYEERDNNQSWTYLK